ncbi:hypothetical protein J4221_02575 [Candidatus Pacearchaeota archaeon]|nr:hypothetical protein [Candidatus Pacearchaeota archaeon]
MVVEFIIGNFRSFYDSIPENQKILFNLLIYTLIILIYSVFIWKYYKFLANKQILDLNLKQYNYTSHPVLEKILATVLYTLEYLIILPFLIIFWFAVLSVFLLVLSENTDTQYILLIAAAIIASTRITAYLSEELSQDIAKVLPLTVLVVFVLGSNSFSYSQLFERFSHIPGLLNNILIFLIFIFVVEFTLRLIYSFIEFFKSEELD